MANVVEHLAGPGIYSFLCDFQSWLVRAVTSLTHFLTQLLFFISLGVWLMSLICFFFFFFFVTYADSDDWGCLLNWGRIIQRVCVCSVNCNILLQLCMLCIVTIVHIVTIVYVQLVVSNSCYVLLRLCMLCIVIVCSVGPVQLFATLWGVAWCAPLSMGFSRQKYESGLPCPPPGDLPDPGIKPVSRCVGRRILYHWGTWEDPQRIYFCAFLRVAQFADCPVGGSKCQHFVQTGCLTPFGP